jgi:hypothetical protein
LLQLYFSVNFAEIYDGKCLFLRTLLKMLKFQYMPNLSTGAW